LEIHSKQMWAVMKGCRCPRACICMGEGNCMASVARQDLRWEGGGGWTNIQPPVCRIFYKGWGPKANLVLRWVKASF